jgi:hypothetical protein
MSITKISYKVNNTLLNYYVVESWIFQDFFAVSREQLNYLEVKIMNNVCLPLSGITVKVTHGLTFVMCFVYALISTVAECYEYFSMKRAVESRLLFV